MNTMARAARWSSSVTAITVASPLSIQNLLNAPAAGHNGRTV
jgi:hypothetical protein